jgi:hypothetical protein
MLLVVGFFQWVLLTDWLVYHRRFQANLTDPESEVDLTRWSSRPPNQG